MKNTVVVSRFKRKTVITAGVTDGEESRRVVTVTVFHGPEVSEKKADVVAKVIEAVCPGGVVPDGDPQEVLEGMRSSLRSLGDDGVEALSVIDGALMVLSDGAVDDVRRRIIGSGALTQ